MSSFGGDGAAFEETGSGGSFITPWNEWNAEHIDIKGGTNVTTVSNAAKPRRSSSGAADALLMCGWCGLLVSYRPLATKNKHRSSPSSTFARRLGLKIKRAVRINRRIAAAIEN